MHSPRCLCILAIVIALGLAMRQPVAAQQAAPAAPPVPVPQPTALPAAERARLESYARILQGELDRAEARAQAATDQLVALDDDIESRIDRIVALLSSVKDSAEGSSVRLRKAKEDALEGLKATAVFYAQQRDFRKKAMANPNSSIGDGTLAKDVAALNARIEERIAQSLKITASLTTHQDGRVDRYENEDTDYDDETREHKKTERDARASVTIKKDLVDTLNTSIEKLSRDAKACETELAAATDPVRKEQLTKDLETLRQTMAARRSQIEEAVTASSPAPRAVAGKGAFELEKMIHEMTLELRSDFAKFKSLVGEVDAARARLKPLRDRLAAVSARLEAGAPTAP